MLADFDIFPDTRRPNLARKSDTFLHAGLKQQLAGPTRDDARSLGGHRKDPQGSSTFDLLQPRLSQMFDDRIARRERRSVDIIHAFDHRRNGHSGVIEPQQLSQKQVPNRQSSLANSRQASLQDFPSWRLPPPNTAGKIVVDRGRADSPLKKSVAEDTISSDTIRSSPSRTFVRPSPPMLLLQNGSISSKRINLSIDLNAPIFVGGGTIEGKINVVVDRNQLDHTKKRKDLLISKLSVDVVGCELMSDGRKWIFLALATELFDEKHPPPPIIVPLQRPTAGPELF